MASLPVRGPDARALGLPLPPARMPLWRDGRPLKRWRYVGVYGPELMLCVGDARVAGIPQRWWAVALPDGTLRERTTGGRGGVRLGPGTVRVRARDVEIDLALDEVPWSASGGAPEDAPPEGHSESGRARADTPPERSSASGRAPEDAPAGGRSASGAVEVVSPHGGSFIWTRKQGDVPVRGRVRVGDREWAIDGVAFIDDSAGYHARRTRWRWSAGVGRGEGGERVAWNLVDGVHDAPTASERTVWVDGEPREVGPVAFASDLAAVADLRFGEWSAREDHTNRLLLRSHYRQPFGTFAGALPGGPGLAEGYGVMEWHDVLW
jgi:uncharacterized protein DUF2804